MTKMLSDYEASILQHHIALQHLPVYHPDYEKIDAQLSRQRKAWSDKLNITIQVANNEKLPWISEELGLPCIPMSSKKDSMDRQVGDYVAYLDDYDRLCGLVVERKTLEDIYGTLMNRERRSRLYREILRYEQDDRFNGFHLIAECTYEEFLKYVPSIFVFTADSAPETMQKNIIQYLQRFYKIKVLAHQINRPHYDTISIMTADHQIFINLVARGAEVFIDGVLRETLVPIKSYQNKIQYFIRRGASEISKIETINSLENRIQVSFVGSRERAVEKYSGLVRKWCVKNYVKILNIEA